MLIFSGDFIDQRPVLNSFWLVMKIWNPRKVIGMDDDSSTISLSDRPIAFILSAKETYYAPFTYVSDRDLDG